MKLLKKIVKNDYGVFVYRYTGTWRNPVIVSIKCIEYKKIIE